MTTRLYLKVYAHGERGPLYEVRLDAPDGEMLLRTWNPYYDGARALLKRGVHGRYETWVEGKDYCHMYGDIEEQAKWTIVENDDGIFRRRWTPPEEIRARAGLRPSSRKAVSDG